MHEPQQQPQPMSPEDQAILAKAKEDEVTALSEYLQNRVLFLNVEVRRRDARIAELEAVLAETSPSPEDAWGPQDHAVSEGGSGDQPQ